MRNSFKLSTAVLLLAFSGVAGAQQKAQAPAPKAPAITQYWELGFRGTSVDGDEARYERYRDLQSGLQSKIGIGKETDASAWDFSAANVGYNDQQYAVKYNKFGKLKLTADFTGTPLNYAYNTLTPYKYAGNNVWTLDAAARTSVQNKVPGVVGIGTNAATDVATIYRGLATTFPMSQQRDVMGLGLQYRVNDLAAVDFKFNSTKKSGNQPFGAAFAFNNAEEIPMALDNRTNDITAGLEINKPKYGMVRAEYSGSFFKNNFESLTWDNPLRATDFNNGKLPKAGPYDPSGYSNGNGPAFGRLSLPPTNSMNTVRALGLYKMPGHTVINGQVSYTVMKQDEDLLPYTTNSVINSPVVWAAFPGLARLPRASAQAEVQGFNALVNFTTRPTDYFAFDMRYRFNDHKNQTPHYDYTYNVRFDAVPEYVPGEGTEHLNIRQNTMEAAATFTLPKTNYTALKFGYIMDDVKREGRAFSDMTDYTFRVSVDAYQNRLFNLRALFENTSRIGSGLSLETIEEGGGQEALRFYDEADMDRNKGTIILGLTPSSKFDMNFSLATGKDSYKGEGHEFGLLDNTNSSADVTLNVYPSDKVTLGGSYGREKITSLLESRNANPFSGVVGAYESWNDPNRNWSLDNDETVTNAGLWIDLIKALPNTDVRFSLNYSDSDLGYTYGGPRIQELSTNTALTPGDTKPCATGLTSCFIPLPNVTNTWTQAKVDVKHMFKPSMGVGLGYSYEKLDIADWATTNLADGSPRMDPLGSISTGYGNRPYKGSTVMARLIYMF